MLLLKTGCLVTSDQLRDPPQSVPARSTQSVCDDFKSFTAAGVAAGVSLQLEQI